MEKLIIPLTMPEIESNDNMDDPRTLALNQATEQRDKALKIIHTEEESAQYSQNIIDTIKSDPFVPTILIKVHLLEYEYDIWTYTSTIRDTFQYSVRTNSINDALNCVAKYLAAQKSIETRLEPGLGSLEMAIGTLLVKLKCPTNNKNGYPEWNRIFNQAYSGSKD
jgi:hypothetical protein